MQTFGIVNAAEVFVFASGMVTAWLLGRLLASRGLRAVMRRSFARAGQLYVTHLAMMTVLLWAVGAGIIHVKVLPQYSPAGLFLRAACFIFQPAFLDILPMYVCFLLAAPLVLTQLAKGRAVLVGAVSFGLWMTSWYVPVLTHQTFNVLAWQFMFISGMIAGHWRLSRGRSTSLPATAILVCCAITAVFGVLGHPGWFGLTRIIGRPLEFELTYKHLLMPARLLNFGAVAAVVVSIPRRVDAWVPRPVYRGLVLLGQSSLQVFVWSVATSYLVRTKFLSWQNLGTTQQMVIALTFALSLFIPALLHRMLCKPKTRARKTRLILRPAASLILRGYREEWGGQTVRRDESFAAQPE